MKSAHNPRPLIILILILVAAAFLVGILRAFRRADAAGPTPANASLNARGMASAGLTPTPVPTESDTDLSAQPTPTLVPASADTTGIIALAIVIVTTILVGATWGVRRSPQKKIPPR